MFFFSINGICSIFSFLNVENDVLLIMFNSILGAVNISVQNLINEIQNNCN